MSALTWNAAATYLVRLEKQLLTWPRHGARFLPLAKQHIVLFLPRQRGASFTPKPRPHQFPPLYLLLDGSKGRQSVAGARCYVLHQSKPASCLVRQRTCPKHHGYLKACFTSLLLYPWTKTFFGLVQVVVQAYLIPSSSALEDKCDGSKKFIPVQSSHAGSKKTASFSCAYTGRFVRSSTALHQRSAIVFDLSVLLSACLHFKLSCVCSQDIHAFPRFTFLNVVYSKDNKYLRAIAIQCEKFNDI